MWSDVILQYASSLVHETSRIGDVVREPDVHHLCGVADWWEGLRCEGGLHWVGEQEEFALCVCVCVCVWVWVCMGSSSYKNY